MVNLTFVSYSVRLLRMAAYAGHARTVGRAAEAAGFDVLVTTDRNIRHQQNLTHRKIAIVVLGKARWKLIKERLANVARHWLLPNPVGVRRTNSRSTTLTVAL